MICKSFLVLSMFTVQKTSDSTVHGTRCNFNENLKLSVRVFLNIFLYYQVEPAGISKRQTFIRYVNSISYFSTTIISHTLFINQDECYVVGASQWNEPLYWPTGGLPLSPLLRPRTLAKPSLGALVVMLTGPTTGASGASATGSAGGSAAWSHLALAPPLAAPRPAGAPGSR